MKRQSNRSSQLFLTELMIAIFFFAVILAICIQAFSEAHRRSMESKELTQSVNAVSNTAEYFMVWDGDKAGWQEVFPEGRWEAEEFLIEFDKDFQPVVADGEYLLKMTIREEDGLKKADIGVTTKEAERTVYRLEVMAHGN